MNILNGTNQKSVGVLAISKSPAGGTKRSADALESELILPAGDTEKRPSKRIRTEKDEYLDISQHDDHKEALPPSVTMYPPLKRPRDETEPNIDSSNEHVTLELKQLASVDDQSPSTHSKCDDRKPAKRPRVDESASPDNSEDGDTVNKVLLLPMELLDLILEQLWEPENIECASHFTLSAFARTCTRWRSAARPHIFRYILIRSEESLCRFAELVRAEPNIANWIRKVRIDVYPERPDYGDLSDLSDQEDQEDPKGYEDRWVYQFPTILGVTAPNIRILELFHFKPIYDLREDLEAFACWIPHLAQLKSVEHLNLWECQMSANAMTAMVRALPSLTRAFFVECDFHAPEKALLCDWSSGSDRQSPSTPARSALALEAAPAPEKIAISSSTNRSSFDDHDAPVVYPLLHPPPTLQSLVIGNDETDFDVIDFEMFRDWLDSGVLSSSLRSLHVGSDVDTESLRKSIASLGPSLALEYLKISLLIDPEFVVPIAKQVSNLPNLKTLRIATLYLERDQPETLHQFLVSLDAPSVRSLTIIMVEQEPVEDTIVIDEYLAGDKFKDFHEFRLEFLEANLWNSVKVMEDVAQAMFPLMSKKPVFHVEWFKYMYPYPGCY
ncbi:unnamed protein product [Somion occarium]|uniref:F-box domain-containing protein n=1 Tax=Somion occarium TaxID=3059160 RepID=A0ABP1DLI4_9APHY